MKLEALVGGACEVVGPEVTLADAAAAMVDDQVDCLAVIDGRKLVGLITERDLVRAVADESDFDEETVGTYMTEAPDIFSPEVPVTDAAKWLLEAGYRHLPVMSEGELLGIVGIRDLLFVLAEDA